MPRDPRSSAASDAPREPRQVDLPAADEVARAEFAGAQAGDPTARQRALDALVVLPRAARAALLDASAAAELVLLLDDAKRSAQRNAAERLAALARDCPALVEALRTALVAAHQRLRWGAAFTLGRADLAGIEQWPAAREAMALDDGDQRWAAAELACAIARAHPDTERELVAALDDPNPVLRKMCLYCLRDLGARSAAPAAARALADPDVGVRLAALAALSALPPGATAPDAPRDVATAAIAGVLAGDPDLGVRRAAAAALGRIASAAPIVRQALEAAAAGADASLARAAATALERLAKSSP